MTTAFYMANCIDCNKDLTSHLANFGTREEPFCFGCGMTRRARAGLNID